MLGEKSKEPRKQRIDVNVTRACVDSIDEIIESSMLFNNRSDFVIQALRQFTMGYMATAKDMLGKITKRYGQNEIKPEHYQAILDDYTSAMRTLGAQLDERFRTTFGGALTEQIPIRINQNFYTRLKDMNELSPLGIQGICRMAIKDYYEIVKADSQDLTTFVQDYNTLLENAECTDSDEEDLTKYFDRNRPRRNRHA